MGALEHLLGFTTGSFQREGDGIDTDQVPVYQLQERIVDR